MDYLDQSLALKATNALGEILRLTTIEVIIAYFRRLIDNIQYNKKGYFSVNIAAQFLRLFFNKDNWTRASLVDSFQKDYQILDLLIKELGFYLG